MESRDASVIHPSNTTYRGEKTMDPIENDGSVLAALETLENAEDQEILQYRERLLNVGNRLLSLTKQTSSVPDSRPRTAADIFRIVIQEQPQLHKFLSDDPTSAIRTIRTYDNLQITSFAADDQLLLGHIFDLRNWIWDYRARYLPEVLSKSMQDIPLKIPPQQGKLKRFIHSRDLPNNIYTRLKTGHRCWYIEAKAYQKTNNMIPNNSENNLAGPGSARPMWELVKAYVTRAIPTSEKPRYDEKRNERY
ncbi:hypothetical protein TSTA_084410 [Talaromyces stipitatus ATCC 10500]|uniref:Uncharacterized protein n=1 Tax=Talaromyces stipitatus (strain ATCC 10500 / CBS 375.48 / QM 6759 / NRRL 1006) TaxID=441959 RepID=B8M0B3_TALSN|nr:uncharacterized protein TSTA_084410 [Talaromyces stipitatus ATCC 10500]EED21210.1 hypothetical protein TSTA_084410 [Talaromyces stipitatus ATCC 10500]